MGYAIAEGFKMTNPNLKILASDSNWNLDRIQKWNDIGSNQTQKNENIFENCRLVVLSVKPQSIQVRSSNYSHFGKNDPLEELNQSGRSRPRSGGKNGRSLAW